MEQLNALVKKEMFRTAIWIVIAAAIAVGSSYLW